MSLNISRPVSALLLIALLGCAPAQDDEESARGNVTDCAALEKRMMDPAWHMAMLKKGCFRLAGTESSFPGEPFHVWMLRELGVDSVRVLIDALNDDTPTGVTYHGTLTWRGGGAPDNAQEAVATIGDVADYVFRVVYKTDVGYRSYLKAEERQAAIQRWNTVVRTKPEAPAAE